MMIPYIMLIIMLHATQDGLVIKLYHLPSSEEIFAWSILSFSFFNLVTSSNFNNVKPGIDSFNTFLSPL
ncbi:hypothetical protein GLOIN_2v1494848 [Rhizophagus irregularis DAOM 181602=DAOM 197198]|uniref:Uncharacterized protein n=1 Tax=Rhizophagus irregularis (strain DAOM 181602 / DAOM 197198 / MUCL 43194) TaxID=747089 RepID=A0A2P4QZ38_RHIID|nr:hypothetical protein GLOIN_2v1494848 [Rhizophagus irregularis DAOM 181602=DAOM 197198]POG82909.1 hypothetical protein GLOIN_2v1494848 [Rhizophagus irregularis DAOM 181602=DAOM 197198]|eukprot:XP_025189775.1 hypothetical protein GLOIN_2v1494848 [Rhizophagus irregularis DAOM 181602=DAOM 197198]